MKFSRPILFLSLIGVLLFGAMFFAALSPAVAQNPLTSAFLNQNPSQSSVQNQTQAQAQTQPATELVISFPSVYYGSVGSLVTLSGSGFSLVANTINFGKTKIRNISAKSSSEISFAVPKNTKPGRYDVSVTSGSKTSPSVPFMVTKPGAQLPTIEKVEPAQVKFGQKVTITGKNFTPTDNIFSSNLGIFDELDSKDGKTIELIIPVPDYLKNNMQLQKVWFGSKDNLYWPVWFRVANTNGVTAESSAAKFIINL